MAPPDQRDPTHAMYEAACDLLETAQALQQSAERSGVIEAIPATLGTLEETLQVLSASCYRLAGECAPGVSRAGVRSTQGRAEHRSVTDRTEAFPPENQAHLMATLHDVASGVARAARGCRDGRKTAAPLIARKLNSERPKADAAGTPIPPVPAGGSQPQAGKRMAAGA